MATSIEEELLKYIRTQYKNISKEELLEVITAFIEEEVERISYKIGTGNNNGHNVDK